MKDGQFFSDEQIMALLKAAISGAPCTEAQMAAFVNWCTDVKIHAAMIQLALDGKLVVDVTADNPDDWAWSEPK